MAEREEPLGSGDASTAGGVAEAIAGGADAEVKLGEPLLPLQDSWYHLTSLFPTVGALKVSPPGVPKKWILKGEAPSHETAWVPAASGIIDLWF